MDASPPPPVLRRVVITLLVTAAAFGGGHVLLQKLKGLRKEPERKVGGPPLPVVRVLKVRRQDYREVLRGYGVARAMREASVSAEVGGILRYVAPEVEAGRWVTPPPAGVDGNGPPADDTGTLVRIDPLDLEDVLARMAAERAQAMADDARLRTAVENYEDQVVVIQRRLDTARTELRRILVLVPDTLPESDADRQRLAVFALEQVESELVQRKEEAAAQIEGVKARLQVLDAGDRKARRDLERTRVVAPFPGRIVKRMVELGALVAPGTPLFTIVDPTRVEVSVALPASRYRQIRASDQGVEGSPVTLRLAEDGAVVWEGHVSRIDPRIDAESRTFRVYVEVEHTDDDATTETAVAPGAHLVADVEGALHRDVIPVPREAFVDDVAYVTEAGGDDEPAVARRRRPTVRVQLVGVALVDAAEDDTGIRDGDDVVVSNLEDIADGSRVRTISDDPEAAGP